MTPQLLISRGYKEFSWNGGAIMEYWKSLSSDEDDFDYHLGIRFGEWKDRPFVVYLFGKSSCFPFPHIKTIAEVEALYALLVQR